MSSTTTRSNATSSTRLPIARAPGARGQVEDGQRGRDTARTAEERSPVDGRAVRGPLDLRPRRVGDVAIVDRRRTGYELAVRRRSLTKREHGGNATSRSRPTGWRPWRRAPEPGRCRRPRPVPPSTRSDRGSAGPTPAAPIQGRRPAPTQPRQPPRAPPLFLWSRSHSLRRRSHRFRRLRPLHARPHRRHRSCRVRFAPARAHRPTGRDRSTRPSGTASGRRAAQGGSR